MAVSRVIGALFLAGFMFYGVGSVLATSVTGGSNFLSTISVNKTLLILGAFLIYITIPSIIAEISILVYLLVFGVRTRKSDEQFLAA
jgi:hypothetical protein